MRGESREELRAQAKKESVMSREAIAHAKKERAQASIAKERRKARQGESGAKNLVEPGVDIIVGVPETPPPSPAIEGLQTREEQFGTVKTKTGDVRPIEGLQTRAESLGTASETEEEFGAEDTEISKTIVREPTPRIVKVVKGKPETPPSAEAVIKKADDAEIERILANIHEMPENRPNA